MIGIDIDGTIAQGSVPGLLAYFRERLQLPLIDLPDELTWWDVFDLPEVKVYRETHPEDYQEARNTVTGSLAVLATCEPEPDAVRAVHMLATRDTLQYLTLRNGDPVSQAVTCGWLARQQFPSFTEVIYCHSFPQKLATLMQQPGTHILIEDRYDKVVEALRALEASAYPHASRMLTAMRERLTLIAYGTPYLDDDELFPGISMVALPTWSDLPAIEHIFSHEAIQLGA